MKSQWPLPPGRTLEQLRNHYLVEKEIAKKLKEADREERKRIYKEMYDELFRKVPDHPRLTRRNSEELTRQANRDKFSIVGRFLDKAKVFAEFGPGDCRFAYEVAKRVKYVYGIDISDQRNPNIEEPENFRLIVYDGYNLEGIRDGSIDIVLSDQLIEHFHPEDTRLHFELVHRLLAPGGEYVFQTPHYLTGPHDVSRFFSDEPEGFHLKEWTYGEIETMLTGIGYSKVRMYWNGKRQMIRMPRAYFSFWEWLLRRFPKGSMRGPARRLLPAVCMVAVK